MDIEYLRTILDYDKDTGLLSWKTTGSGRKHKIAGSKKDDGYIGVKVNGKAYPAHRIAFAFEYGYVPTNVDHINGKKDDNRICNLRAASRQQNAANRVKLNVNNTSGFRGVYWNKERKAWEVTIRYNGKLIFCGRYKDIQKAHAAHIAKGRELHGEFFRSPTA